MSEPGIRFCARVFASKETIPLTYTVRQISRMSSNTSPAGTRDALRGAVCGRSTGALRARESECSRRSLASANRKRSQALPPRSQALQRSARFRFRRLTLRTQTPLRVTKRSPDSSSTNKRPLTFDSAIMREVKRSDLIAPNVRTVPTAPQTLADNRPRARVSKSRANRACSLLVRVK